MKTRVSQQIWNGIGWTATLLVALSIPYGLADGVMGIFVLYFAIVVGGLSGIGLNATARFGLLTIGTSLLLGLIGASYSRSAGFRIPDLLLVRDVVDALALPILVALAFLSAGAMRREHASRSVRDPPSP